MRVDFPNILWQASVGNALNITECSLERETGVAEFEPVRVGGSRSFTVADNAATTVVSDVISPGDFTGLSEFPANMVFWLRIKGTVTTAGHTIPGMRFGAETDSCAILYDPAASVYSAVDATGPMVYVSGTIEAAQTQAYCPILVGTYAASADPKTVFIIGDSILEGTGGAPALEFQRAAAATLGVPILEMSRGGASQLEVSDLYPQWGAYLKYARVLVDEMGTNNSNAPLYRFRYWQAARQTYTYDKIARIGLFPRTSGTFATEAGQTALRPYPDVMADLLGVDLAAYGLADYNLAFTTVRGTDQAKWAANRTYDGTHPTATGITDLTTDYQPALSSWTVTS